MMMSFRFVKKKKLQKERRVCMCVCVFAMLELD